MRIQRIVVALITIALIAAACGREGSSSEASGDSGASRPAISADFGDLTGVCQPGTTKSASAQGVTATDIEVGVFSDIGFTKIPDFVDAAKVFTSWCNAAGGINGRKISTVPEAAPECSEPRSPRTALIAYN